MREHIWNRLKDQNQRIYLGIVLFLFVCICLGALNKLFGLPSSYQLQVIKSYNDITTSDYTLGVSSIANDRVATAHKDKHVRVHTFAGENIFDIEPVYATHCLNLSDDGHYLAVHAYDGIKVYNVDNQRLERDYRELTCPMTLSPDGNKLAVIKDLQLKIIHIDRNQFLETLQLFDFIHIEHEQLIEKLDQLSKEDNLRFSPDGSLLSLVQDGRGFTVWRAANGEKLYQIDEYVFENNFNFSPNGQFLAVVKMIRTPGYRHNISFEIQLRNANTGEILKTFNDNFQFHQVSFSPDSSRLALSGSGNLIIWHLDGYIWSEIKSTLWPFNYRFYPMGSAISPDNRYVLLDNSYTNSLQMYRIGDGSCLVKMERFISYGIRQLKYSPDGNHFVIIDSNQQIFFYQIQE